MSTTYLITGCSRGLGLELATQLALQHESETRLVFATGRRVTPALEDLIKKSSGRVVFVPLDATNKESVAAAAKTVEEHLGDGGLDVLINNAGIMGFTPNGVENMTDLAEHFEVNVMSVQYVTSAFIPLLRKGNKKMVANITSSFGSITITDQYAYNPAPAYKISKAAMNMLTRQYAFDKHVDGFTFILVSPGWLKTDLGTEYADLPVDVGAKLSLDIILKATIKDNGKFFNIHLPGWKPKGTPNFYDGGELPF